MQENLDREKKVRADVEKVKRKLETDLKATQEAVEELDRLKKELEDTVRRSVSARSVLFTAHRKASFESAPVAAGRGAQGACTPGGTVQGAAFGKAKIWNSKILPVLVNWRLHCRQ